MLNDPQCVTFRTSLVKPSAGYQRGFTLVELISVMVIAGVLAAFAAPRFFDRNVFERRGFYDQVLSTLRYAQKVAIAQHRLVCVAVTAAPAKVALTVASLSTDTTCAAPLNLPSSDKNFVTATDATLSTASFAFNALGSPFDLPYASGNPSVAHSLSVNDYTITVEKETGYVH